MDARQAPGEVRGTEQRLSSRKLGGRRPCRRRERTRPGSGAQQEEDEREDEKPETLLWARAGLRLVRPVRLSRFWCYLPCQFATVPVHASVTDHLFSSVKQLLNEHRIHRGFLCNRFTKFNFCG
jgi:hypothetical protein